MPFTGNIDKFGQSVTGFISRQSRARGSLYAMRFVLSTFIFGAFYAAAMTSTNAQTFARTDSSQAEAPRDPADLRRRAVGSQEKPVITKGLYAQRVSSGLGHISAMVSLDDGSIYALAKDSGQIFHLTDRGIDGRIDTQRALASGFETPTGLIFKDGDLYVSDMHAIWRVNIDTGQSTQFVSLKNITASKNRPLLSYENRILLGLSTSASLSKVLSVDAASGEATHLTDIPEGPIRSLSYGGGQLWAAVGTTLRPVDGQSNTEFAKAYPLEIGTAALAVMLPAEDTVWPKGWPVSMKDYILAIQGPSSASASAKSSGGNNVVALPTQFGAPIQNVSILAGGFMSRDGQSAWAAPTALLMDSRGLFFADRIGGTLWRVSVDNRPPPKPRVKIGKAPPKLPTQKPSLKPNETPAMIGSKIGEASGLGNASRLTVGSKLKQEHDDKEAAKLAAEKSKEESEIKVKTDALEARRKRISGSR